MEQQASRTAVLVCQGRAVAHGRLAVGRFDDPTAASLLRGDELTPVEHARSDARPRGVAAKMDFEMLGRQAEAMALRTVVVDDAIRTAANPQVVILGAGLDGRAWRLTELAAVDVFEVDHPASQTDKQVRAAALTPVAGALRFVPVDFAHDDLGAELSASGHDTSKPTTWILEGVIPYLTEEDAAATVEAVATLSAPGSVLVLTYQLDSSSGALSRRLARLLLKLAGRGDPMANEPRRSSWSPESVRSLLTGAGLEVSDDVGLADVARELSVPDRHVGASRVAVGRTPG